MDDYSQTTNPEPDTIGSTTYDDEPNNVSPKTEEVEPQTTVGTEDLVSSSTGAVDEEDAGKTHSELVDEKPPTPSSGLYTLS